MTYLVGSSFSSGLYARFAIFLLELELLCSFVQEAVFWLSRVDQSPPESMYNALRPTMAVLITNELLEHADPNVKVAITSCLTEVTRITAQEGAPYDDDVMKVRFVAILGMETMVSICY
jgi:hypothetical protein